MRRQPLSIDGQISWTRVASCLVRATDNKKREYDRGTEGVKYLNTSTAICAQAGEDTRPRDLVQHVSMKTVVRKSNRERNTLRNGQLGDVMQHIRQDGAQNISATQNSTVPMPIVVQPA